MKYENLLTDELIDKYSWTAPYYTSYPTLGRWADENEENFKSALKDLMSRNEPVSLYFHFPFCKSKCFYCFCVSKATGHEEIKNFLKDIAIEIELFKKFFDKNGFKPNVKEIQIGGGSPSYMADEELEFFIEKIKLLANLKEVDEFAFEIDPRTINPEKIEDYKKIGVNRISFGVQDFNPEIQKIVNRIQPKELVEKFFTQKIRKGLKGINIDLLYGLPLQTRESFRETVKTAIELSPDRITLLRYAHMPEREPHQRVLDKYKFPEHIEKVKTFKDAMDEFTKAGYVHVGINDFVKPDDELAIALKNKTLHRIFNGFTPGRAENLIAIGPSSTSAFLNYYFQNVYPEDYKEKVKKGFPISRGYILNRDELIRRDIINYILCERALDFKKIEEKHNIDFKKYFKDELERLKLFEEDGLLEFSDNGIEVTYIGRIFMPHISSVFDAFLKNERYKMSGPRVA